MLNFRTKRGELSAYALACGYVDLYDTRKIRISLYHEHNVYHIQGREPDGRICESFGKLEEARKRFRELKRVK